MKERSYADTLYPFAIKNNKLLGTRRSKDTVNESIGTRILSSLQSAPDFIGQVDAETGRTTTFQEMREKSIKCALHMQTYGIKKGDVVTICICNHIDAYIPYLACLYLGVIADLWHEDYTKDSHRILSFLIQRRPKMVFTRGLLVDKIFVCTIFLFMFFLPIITIDRRESGYFHLPDIVNKIDSAHIDQFSCESSNMMDIALIMFSPSTTTYHGNISLPYMIFSSKQQTLKMQNNDVGLWYMPFYSLQGPFLTVYAIIARVTVIKPGEFSETGMYEIIQKHKVNWMVLESRMCNKMSYDVNIASYDISSLKEIVIDSGINYKAYVDLMNLLPDISIIKVYSMMETGVIAYQKNSSKFGSSGYVAQAMQVMIIDINSRKILPSQSCGEIWCKCPFMTLKDGVSNYIFNSEWLFRKSSPVDRSRLNEGWFYTGDWGYYDTDGAIYVIDKVSYLIRVQDHIITPTPMINILEECPHVTEAFVISTYNIDECTISAFFNTTQQFKIDDLLEHLQKHPQLPENLKDELFLLYIDIPRLPNGKVDKMRFVKMDEPYCKRFQISKVV